MSSPSNVRIPEDIPIPDRDSLQDTFEKSTLAMEMDIGAPRQRRIRSIAPRRFLVTFKMNLAQYQEFDYWYQNSIKGGSLEFDMQLLDDQHTLVWYTCNVIGNYTYENVGTNLDAWLITMTVRSKYPSFATRAPGTDDLHGLIVNGASLQGMLSVPYVMRGKITTDTNLQSLFGAGKMLGEIDVGVGTSAMFASEFFQGRVDVDVTAQAQFT